MLIVRVPLSPFALPFCSPPYFSRTSILDKFVFIQGRSINAVSEVTRLRKEKVGEGRERQLATLESRKKRERSRPVLMSGESACPIIEAMLRAQIAETRHSDERGEGGQKSMGGRLKTSQLKTSRVDLSVLETCRKSSSIPALLGERRFYFTVFPISPFPFASPSSCYNI